MTNITALLLTVVAAMSCIMVIRIYGDWLRIGEAVERGTAEDMDEIMAALQGWQFRHLSGAGIAVVILACIRLLPSFHADERMAGLVAGYAAISLLFAACETLLAQRLAVVRVRTAGRR